MEIQLTKDYVLINKKLPKGTKFSVTNEKGNELIKKGVAVDITVKHQRELQKKRDEDVTEIVEAIKEIKKQEEENGIAETAKKIKEKTKKN